MTRRIAISAGFGAATFVVIGLATLVVRLLGDGLPVALAGGVIGGIILFVVDVISGYSTE